MRILLSSSSGVPMYEQIKAQVRAATYSGDLSEGDMLPSLRQLAADLRVSVMTVTRAYNDLVAEHVIANEHGRGFLVLPVDADSARTATNARLGDAISEIVDAARAARLTRTDIHQILDEKWSDE
jgi:GntR family transcriptional regulator